MRAMVSWKVAVGWGLCAVLALGGCEENVAPAFPDGASGDSAVGAPGEDVAVGVQADGYADTDPSALTDFRASLDPHGQWVDDETYGTVWVPNRDEVGADFTPYVSSGHWAYDDDNYVWVSDYDWGWAPFHYGRWVWADGTGWMWIPGRTYAGAWVDWRVGDGVDYVGWSPMPPMWGWHGGVAVGFGYVPPPRFVYVGRGEIFEPGIGGRILPHDRAIAVEGQTHLYASAGDRHVLAQPHAYGPSPASLGYEPSRLPHAAAEPGLARARAFSSPSTAARAGARAPSSHVVRPRPPRTVRPRGRR